MVTSAYGEGQYRQVRLNDLITDGRFNRPVAESQVRRILADLDPRAFGAIILWERDPGEYVILDGQHRVEALRRAGVPDELKCIPAIVHSDLTLSMASRLFVELNASKLVSAYDKFNALLTAGDNKAADIERIVRTHDMTVGSGTKDGCISAVAALYYVYEMGEPEGQVLALTLKTLRTAWDINSEAFRSPILRGVALYFHQHRDAQADAIATALIKVPGAPVNLLGWAKGLAGSQRMPLDQAVAQIMETRVVNRKRRPKSA